MESSNFHHEQPEEDHHVVDSSCYGLSWSSNAILNTTINDMSSRDGTNIDHVPCHNTSAPMLEIPWINAINSNDITSSSNPMENLFMSTQEMQRVARIKDEFISSSVESSYPKFSEMINSSSPTSSIEDLHLNNPSQGFNNNNQDLLLSTFSNGCQIKGGQQLIDQFPPDDAVNNNLYQSCSSRTSSRGSFSQIFPTINISNLNQSPNAAISSNTFDINLPALDLFGSPRFNGNFPSSLINNPHQVGSFFKDTCLSYGLDQMHQPNHRQVICNSKIPSAYNTTRPSCKEQKRPATNFMDTKAPQATLPKKSKLESRVSCSPFKVRKEKLGDRIAALQQMVAPFGKTDTASVLMEAIGYIKFLQNQVEVPMEDGNEGARRDLKSRGLCLVPLSCLSYVTDGGGGVWPAP